MKSKSKNKNAHPSKNKVSPDWILGLEQIWENLGLNTDDDQRSAKSSSHHESPRPAKLWILGTQCSTEEWQSSLKELPEEIRQRFLKNKAAAQVYLGSQGLEAWVLLGDPSLKPRGQQLKDSSAMRRSAYALSRDHAASAWIQLIDHQASVVECAFISCDDHEKLGALVGFAMAGYDYKALMNPQRPKADALKKTEPARVAKGPSLVLKTFKSKSLLSKAEHLSFGVNLARHLINLPPDQLNPETYEHHLRALTQGYDHIKINVISGQDLLKERMELLHAVGRGGADAPRLLHFSYRPPSTKKVPVALVGKGITFDSGGLDIKPSSGMRLMKKDMGGSAAVVGWMIYTLKQQSKQPFDVYLSLAENAVDGRSFHPSDVYRSRSGKTVEIHNTDAEGRLVMADAIDYALDQSPAPSLLIDVATLTGAIKVALGTEVSGLFSNDDQLAQALFDAGQSSGERCWRMPLVQDYRQQLYSSFADLSNCSATGMGGAITAALFLESFVRSTPWAHLDIYSWNERPQGPFRDQGGSGQGVQLLVHWLGL